MSQVILFDLDGTLTESGDGIIKSVQYALEKLGIREENPETLLQYIGPPLKESFMTFHGLSEEQAEQGITYYRERYTQVGMFENQLYPQIPELLEVLKINDKILGVASSKPEIFVKQILERFGIAQYFQVIVGSELDGTRAKKEEVIEEALARLHMQTERDKILMVGDRAQDVDGARSCGLQCIGVSYGYGTKEELESAGAVYIAPSVEDLGILASPNDEETTEHVESVRKNQKNRWERKGITRRIKTDKGKPQKSKPEKTKPEKKVPKKDVPENCEKEEEFSVGRTEIHPIMQIWRVFYPILIHLGISVVVSICFSVVLVSGIVNVTDMAGEYDIVEKINHSVLYQLIITSVLSGVIAFFLYRSDQRRRKEGFLGQGEDFVWSPPVIWFSVIILAIAGSQMLNDLIRVLRLNEVFPYYSQMTDDTMAGQPVWLLFLTVGILAPIAEELIFRGLVFRRMKDFMKPWMAIVLSGLLFGIYHGNMIQFLYASLLGILLSLIYHRTGTLWTPILAHVVANLWSLFGNEWWDSLWSKLPFGIIIGLVIELLLCVIPAYWILADRRKEKAKK